VGPIAEGALLVMMVSPRTTIFTCVLVLGRVRPLCMCNEYVWCSVYLHTPNSIVFEYLCM